MPGPSPGLSELPPDLDGDKEGLKNMIFLQLSKGKKQK